MLTFKIPSLWYFANISVHISPNNKKLEIFNPIPHGMCRAHNFILTQQLWKLSGGLSMYPDINVNQYLSRGVH